MDLVPLSVLIIMQTDQTLEIVSFQYRNKA